jgi:hypothetical protein
MRDPPRFTRTQDRIERPHQAEAAPLLACTLSFKPPAGWSDN